MTFMLLRFDTEKYRAVGERNDALSMLLYFLNYDVGSDGSRASSFKEWALSTEWQETSSNVSSLRKNKDNIIIEDLFKLGEEISCEIKLQNFLQILDKWEEMGIKRPPQLVLVDRGNGDVSLEETYAHRDLSK